MRLNYELTPSYYETNKGYVVALFKKQLPTSEPGATQHHLELALETKWSLSSPETGSTRGYMGQMGGYNGLGGDSKKLPGNCTAKKAVTSCHVMML